MMMDFWSFATFFSLTHLWHEALGTAGLVLYLLGGAQRSDRRLMALMGGSALCWAGAYWQAGAAVAALCCALAALRYAARLQWGAGRSLLAVFILSHLALGVWGYQGARDLLPLGAALLQSWAVFCWEGVRLRRVYLAVSLCWLSYSLLLGSVAGTVEEVLFIAVVLGALWRRRRGQQPAPAPAPKVAPSAALCK